MEPALFVNDLEDANKKYFFLLADKRFRTRTRTLTCTGTLLVYPCKAFASLPIFLGIGGSFNFVSLSIGITSVFITLILNALLVCPLLSIGGRQTILIFSCAIFVNLAAI
jgi:hypothetical protein